MIKKIKFFNCLIRDSFVHCHFEFSSEYLNPIQIENTKRAMETSSQKKSLINILFTDFLGNFCDHRSPLEIMLFTKEQIEDAFFSLNNSMIDPLIFQNQMTLKFSNHSKTRSLFIEYFLMFTLPEWSPEDKGRIIDGELQPLLAKGDFNLVGGQSFSLSLENIISKKMRHLIKIKNNSDSIEPILVVRHYWEKLATDKGGRTSFEEMGRASLELNNIISCEEKLVM